jgi:hypothetical protein
MTRLINKSKTHAIYTGKYWTRFWYKGMSENEIVKDLGSIGWNVSNESLKISKDSCVYCEGDKSFSTFGEITLHIKCEHCDGTGFKLINK